MVTKGGVRGHGSEDGARPLNAGCSLFLSGVSTIPQICSTVRITGLHFEGKEGGYGPKNFN